MGNKEADSPLLTFAAIEWQKRWNGAGPDAPVAMLDRQGSKMYLLTCLGFVQFDLEDDGPVILARLEAAVDLLRKELS